MRVDLNSDVKHHKRQSKHVLSDAQGIQLCGQCQTLEKQNNDHRHVVQQHRVNDAAKCQPRLIRIGSL